VVVRRDGFERAACELDRRDGAGDGRRGVVLAGERGVRGGRRRAQVLGVAEALRLGGERGVLTGLRIDALELVETGTERLDLERALLRGPHEVVELGR